MTTETSNARDVHTCSYACERPECIRAQRDELASRLAAAPPAAARGDVPYDRELIARMLDVCGHPKFTLEAYMEQARLLREADNAAVANVGTVAARGDVRGLVADRQAWFESEIADAESQWIDNLQERFEDGDDVPDKEHFIALWLAERAAPLAAEGVQAGEVEQRAQGELRVADIREDAREPLQLLREKLAHDEDGWAALCQLMPMLAAAPPPALAAEGVQAGEVEQRARELLEAECGKPLPIDVPVCAAHSAVVAALSQQPETRGVVDGPEGPGRTLYIDLDGVMADFDGSFPTVFGLDHRSLADDDMWQHINGHASFFRDLPPMAGAIDFFRSVEHLNPVILTACPKSNYPHVAAQKRAWVREHLSSTCLVLPVLGGRHKPLFMHQPGDILIDDWGKNCAAWTEAGGVAIKHEGDWAATSELLTAALTGERNG